MLRYSFVLLTFSFIHFAAAQDNVKKYVQENTVTIKAIDPDSTDYTDLEAFGKAVGNARVVMLGEQDHGDAPTFLAKTRLIQYLREKKGFTVLAFEGDFFGLNYGWGLVKKGTLTVDNLIRKNIYPIWTNCDACQPLFDRYMPATLQTDNPLILAGFDNQVYTKPIYPILDSVLRGMELPITKQPDYATSILPFLESWSNHITDDILNTKVTTYLTEIKSQLLTVLPNTDFWVMTVDNLIQKNLQFRNLGKDYWKDMNTRDRQMAANLDWLVNVQYANQKIIVWAHNYHISKFAGHYPDAFMNAAMTMGSVFTANVANATATYVVGFASYEGMAGRLTLKRPYKVDKPKENSFENWIPASLPYAFVDFTPYNAQYPNMKDNFYMSGAIKGNWYHKSDKAQWNRVFDGVFYIRTMYSCIKD